MESDKNRPNTILLEKSDERADCYYPYASRGILWGLFFSAILWIMLIMLGILLLQYL